jgi:hypothetical protein
MPKDKPKKPVIAEEVIPFYDLFQDITKRDPFEVSAYFEDIEQESDDPTKDIVAYCMSYEYNNGNYIVVDKGYWSKYNVYGRETMVLHELGHCVLNRDHDETLFDDKKNGYINIPASIMFPKNIGEQPYYELNRDYYLKELGDAK